MTVGGTRGAGSTGVGATGDGAGDPTPEQAAPVVASRGGAERAAVGATRAGSGAGDDRVREDVGEGHTAAEAVHDGTGAAHAEAEAVHTGAGAARADAEAIRTDTEAARVGAHAARTDTGAARADTGAAGADDDGLRPAVAGAHPERPADHDGPPPPEPPDEPADRGEGDEPGEWAPEARWVHPFLVVAGVLGLLLLGAAAGLLIGFAGRDEPVVPGADSVDVGFAQDMTVHHQQAVEMAAWERDHSTDPILVQLASDIETTQNSQIGRMQGWLELWGASALPIGGHMAWMSTPTHDHGGGTAVAAMPGMASSTDLANLRAASGRDLDVLWLQLMLRHHEGGAEMLHYGAQHAAVPQVRNLAAQMLSSQTAESDQLRYLLAERGAQPLPL